MTNVTMVYTVLKLFLTTMIISCVADRTWHPLLRWDTSTIKRISELRAIPPPNYVNRSVSAAKVIHSDAIRRARDIARIAGHASAVHVPPRPFTRAMCASRLHSINPVDYGADPTGKRDSSPAFNLLFASLFNTTVHHKHMAVGIVDLGGATVDLGGGEYLLSKPLFVPPFFGNVHFRDGSLRAAPSFPTDKWLVMVGDLGCKPLLPDGKVDGQGSCVEFITFSEMLFDAAHVAAGGLNIAKAMGATVGPSAFFIGFRKQGIRIDGGHEVMVVETWLAECYWSNFEPLGGPCIGSGAEPEWKSVSVGIQINGPDNYLENVIVFGFTRVGVEINGHMNVLYGVHTWNSAPLPPDYKPGVGISLGGPSSPFNDHNDNRLIGCYLDYNTLDMYDPSHTVVESTMFLGTHAILHAMNRTDRWGNATIEGLVMRYNTFTTKQSIVLDGKFKVTNTVVISDNINSKATTVQRSITKNAATRWDFDFSDALVFPNIEQVTYSVTSDSTIFFQHLARSPKGATVVVETSAPVNATIVVIASQATAPASG